MTPAQQRAALPATAPDEGREIHEQTIRNLRHRMEDALTTPERRRWITDLGAAAQGTVLDDGSTLSYHIGWPNSGNYHPTERRYGIVGGLIALLDAGVVEQFDEDALVRCQVATAVNDTDWPLFPNLPTGAVVGAMNATEAATFYRLCHAIAGIAT